MRRMTSKKKPVFSESGILLVDKPADWTSFDVVNFVRSRFNIPKVGHCGTLDPAATGLLVLVLGDFTRLSSKLSGTDKVYQATLEIGVETDTEDREGNVLGISVISHTETAGLGAVAAAGNAAGELCIPIVQTFNIIADPLLDIATVAGQGSCIVAKGNGDAVHSCSIIAAVEIQS